MIENIIFVLLNMATVAIKIYMNAKNDYIKYKFF